MSEKAGSLRPIVAVRYPLDDAAASHGELEQGHTAGKIVLEIASPLG